MRNNGEVALRLLRRLSARLRESNRQIRNFLSADAMSRAVEVLRALAGPPGEDGFRAVPPDVGPERIATRIPPMREEPALWDRLRRARLVREVGLRAELAPAEVVDAYLRYVELRARFQALAAREVDEVGGLASTAAILPPSCSGRGCTPRAAGTTAPSCATSPTTWS